MIYIRKNLDNILHPNEAYTLIYLDNKGRLVKTTKEIDLYKICNQLYETKDLIDKGIIASTKYDYDECCSYVYGFNTKKAIELIQKHIQELNVTIIQITLDKEQIYSVQNLLKNAKEQIKVRNELISRRRKKL